MSCNDFVATYQIVSTEGTVVPPFTVGATVQVSNSQTEEYKLTVTDGSGEHEYDHFTCANAILTGKAAGNDLQISLVTGSKAQKETQGEWNQQTDTQGRWTADDFGGPPR